MHCRYICIHFNLNGFEVFAYTAEETRVVYHHSTVGQIAPPSAINWVRFRRVIIVISVFSFAKCRISWA